ncbi:hypothetical protein MN608_01914 [Microdochium nivale]|nr:hypothetical protein MN608_01914 [Microdochium nivale]
MSHLPFSLSLSLSPCPVLSVCSICVCARHAVGRSSAEGSPVSLFMSAILFSCFFWYIEKSRVRCWEPCNKFSSSRPLLLFVVILIIAVAAAVPVRGLIGWLAGWLASPAASLVLFCFRGKPLWVTMTAIIDDEW